MNCISFKFLKDISFYYFFYIFHVTHEMKCFEKAIICYYIIKGLQLNHSEKIV